jgi:DNA-directed RNA polymerase subunit beta'
MLSSRNLLKPAAGEPVIFPTLDIVLGCFYLTTLREDVKGAGKAFHSFEEVMSAFNLGKVHLQAKIKFLLPPEKVGQEETTLIETSVGRVIFNSILPSEMPFLNQAMDNKSLKKLLAETFRRFGGEATAELADKIKDVGFYYATLSGTTLSVGDIAIPDRKKEIIAQAEKKTQEIESQYAKGLLTDYERYVSVVSIWRQASSEIEKEMLAAQDKLGPVNTMISSGARGNVTQLTQMGGMKGLVVNPAGEVIEMPIVSNFKEGLSALEYFISSHGTRKGRSDTALRTADAGYLTRRLVDVSQDVIVTMEDCGTKEGITITKTESKEIGENFSDRIRGRVLLSDVKIGKKVFKKAGEIIDAVDALNLEENEEIEEVTVRSPLTCEAEWGVCVRCYGWDLARNKLAELGTAVGVMAAQSIGEPGTQLTMRTFHTGGVLGKDITQGLPRVEEIFEARTPRDAAPLAEMEGVVKILDQGDRKLVRISSERPMKVDFEIPEGYTVLIENGAFVQVKQALASAPNQRTIRSTLNGKATVTKNKITVDGEGRVVKEYVVPLNRAVLVEDGQKVSVGQPLAEGPQIIQHIMNLRGRIAAARYIVHEVQQIYASQGQVINEKHIEVVARQMFSKVRIKEEGDSEYLPGTIVDRLKLMRENEALKKKGKKPAEFEELVLGITKASLKVDSFLSAASFQETTSVLVEAAVQGKVDPLRGLKENTIIGRLIPSGTGFKARYGKK